jgi:hypothetical protein
VGIRFNRTVDSLFLAFHRYLIDRKSYFKVFITYIQILIRLLEWAGGPTIVNGPGSTLHLSGPAQL